MKVIRLQAMITYKGGSVMGLRIEILLSYEIREII